MKCFKFLFKIVFVFCFLQFRVEPVWAQQDLVLLSLENFPPYSWEENGKARGINVEAIEEVRRRSGLPIKITLVPWKRRLSQVQKGEVVGAFLSFRTPEREAYAYYMEPPIHYSTYKIFVRKGEEFSFSSIQDLYGKTIAKNRGFHITDDFEMAVKNQNIDVIEANNMKKGLELLIRGRAKAVVGNVHEVKFFADQLDLSRSIVALPLPIKRPIPAHLIISNKAKIEDRDKVIHLLETTLETMRQEGAMEAIQRKYLPEEMTGGTTELSYSIIN